MFVKVSFLLLFTSSLSYHKTFAKQLNIKKLKLIWFLTIIINANKNKYELNHPSEHYSHKLLQVIHIRIDFSIFESKLKQI